MRIITLGQSKQTRTINSRKLLQVSLKKEELLWNRWGMVSFLYEAEIKTGLNWSTTQHRRIGQKSAVKLLGDFTYPFRVPTWSWPYYLETIVDGIKGKSLSPWKLARQVNLRLRFQLPSEKRLYVNLPVSRFHILFVLIFPFLKKLLWNVCPH